MRRTTRKPGLWRSLLIVGLLLVCVLVVALAVNPAPSAAATKATLRANLTAYMAAWNAHDPMKASRYLALNATFLDMTVGTPVAGRANIRKDVIAYFINACPDCKWTRNVTQTLYGKNKVSYVWTYTGTNTADWVNSTGTVATATGRSFTFSGQTFMKFTDSGKILHEYDYYDAYGFMKQLGWL